MSLTPQVGQIVEVRQRRYLVEDTVPPLKRGDSTLVALSCVDDDAQGQGLEVLWERELDAQVLSAEAEETTPVWSRDGQTIAYRLNTPTGGALVVKNAAGLEPERTLHAVDFGEFLPNSWSVDNSQILCTYTSPQGGPKLALVSTRDGKSTPFASGERSASNGQISPNGKWVAYSSNESGDWEIYVTTFPGATGKWQVSRGGGTEPRWSANGNEIYYVGPKGTLTAVPVTEDGGFTTGVPQPLFRIHSRAPISSTDMFTYDVARDGRFLVNRYVKPDHVGPLTIVLNATRN